MLTYQTDLFVEQLDRDDTILKTYIFRFAFPLTIYSIDLTKKKQQRLKHLKLLGDINTIEPSVL